MPSDALLLALAAAFVHAGWNALKLAPAATVAAVRESSVVVAAAALALSGREEMGRGRLSGAGLVAAGVALISLG